MKNRENIFKKLNIVENIRKTDKLFLLLTLILTFFGLYTILLASDAFSHISGTSGKTFQIVATIIAIVGMLIIANINYRAVAGLWKLYTPIMYILMIALRWIGYSPDTTDNKAWLRIPMGGTKFLSIQPSEILKIIFIINFAYHIDHLDENIDKLHNFILLLGHALFAMGVVASTGDDGSMIIFGIIIAGMIIGSGAKKRYIFILIALVLIIFALIWFDVGPFGGVLADYQRVRFNVIYNPDIVPEIDLKDKIFQQEQGIVSIAKGGVFGVGTKPVGNFHYVPAIENDFIFTFVGQVWGFVGLSILLILLFLLCARMLMIGFSSTDKLGTLICIGTFSMITAQILINVAMCLKVAPVIGITLPFFSKGGTSIVSILACMGFALSVRKFNQKSSLFGRSHN